MYEPAPGEWLIEILGEELDVKGVVQLAPSYFVMLESRIYLSPSLFTGLEDTQAVRQRADQTVQTLNGLATTTWANAEPVRASGLSRCQCGGGRHRFLQGNVSAHFRMRGNLTVVTTGCETPESIKPLSQRAADIAQINPSVAKVLRMMGRRPLDMATLYNVVEAIQGACDSPIHKLGWASKTQLARFKHSASSEALFGDDARHGFQSSKPPKKPMSQKEAVDLVRHIVGQWLTNLSEDSGLDL
ncbi:MAG: hypothetical protein C3F08_00735 [Candidatus Methylomirabilota bacterium]|nr:MAG: hypothetical protein C3F08_00735 [candidate division NC10 bacterium]